MTNHQLKKCVSLDVQYNKKTHTYNIKMYYVIVLEFKNTEIEAFNSCNNQKAHIIKGVTVLRIKILQ